ANTFPGMPAGTFTGSASDYSAITGVRNFTQFVLAEWTQAQLDANPQWKDQGIRDGILRGSSTNVALIQAGNVPPQTSIADCLDGTSNTLMICELAGKPDFYNAQRTITLPSTGAQGTNSGAGWGDGS